MGLFKPDLYRNLAVGFVLGAGLAFANIGAELVASPAQAAAVDAPAR